MLLAMVARTEAAMDTEATLHFLLMMTPTLVLLGFAFFSLAGL